MNTKGGRFMNPMNVTEHLTFSTVRIEAILENDNTQTGTGYFFRFCEESEDIYIPAIITNKHVLENAKKIRIWLHLRDENKEVVEESAELVVDEIEKYCFPHPQSDIDLMLIFVLPLISTLKIPNRKVYFSGIPKSFLLNDDEYKDLIAIDDVLMVGYPDGIWDSKNNRPISRKGITATDPKIDYEGKPEFLIDAACFPGSSGSPVFLYNPINYQSRTNGMMYGQGRIKLLGTLFAGPQHQIQGDVKIIDVPQVQKPVAEIRIPNNLGCVIKARELLAFEEILQTMKK